MESEERSIGELISDVKELRRWREHDVDPKIRMVIWAFGAGAGVGATLSFLAILIGLYLQIKHS